jgi:hypothetical protein
MELFPISETRYLNLTRQAFNLAFEYENGQAGASYSFIYNLDSMAWRKNGSEEDYQRKK